MAVIPQVSSSGHSSLFPHTVFGTEPGPGGRAVASELACLCVCEQSGSFSGESRTVPQGAVWARQQLEPREETSRWDRGRGGVATGSPGPCSSVLRVSSSLAGVLGFSHCVSVPGSQQLQNSLSFPSFTCRLCFRNKNHLCNTNT